MELNVFLDALSVNDEVWHKTSDEEHKEFFNQIMTRAMKVVDLHKEQDGDCVVCTKNIGGMIRAVSWPCSTVSMLMGVENGE